MEGNLVGSKLSALFFVLKELSALLKPTHEHIILFFLNRLDCGTNNLVRLGLSVYFLFYFLKIFFIFKFSRFIKYELRKNYIKI